MNSTGIPRRFSSDILWLGLLLLVVLAIAFLLPVLPNDFWWYLRLGRDILSTGHIPQVDAYSSTAAGQPTIYPMWLSSVFLHLTYQAGGISLVVLLRGICIGIFYSLLWLVCVKSGLPGWLAALLGVISALAGANNWAVRPQLLVYPLFGLSLFIIINALDGKIKHLPWLIPIAALWANLHGSVVLLFLLTGPLWLVNWRNRRLAVILVLMLLATFINPRGPLMWFDSFSIIGAQGNTFSQEWKPPVNSGWQMNLFFAWLLAIIPLAALSPRRLKAVHWIWLLGFGWMALSGLRYVIWFLAILLVLSAVLLSGWKLPTPRPQPRKFLKINAVFAGILVALTLLLLPGLREKWWASAPPAISENTPSQAVNWIKTQDNLEDVIFNDYVYGSYLIYALPERQVWIDSRFYPFSKETWQDYLKITNAAPEWPDLVARYNIKTMILDQTSQPDLIQALLKQPGWCPRYKVDPVFIFSRCE